MEGDDDVDVSSDSISKGDAEDLLIDFTDLMRAFEFDKARVLLEMTKEGLRRPLASSLWSAIIDALLGLVRCEVTYFSLGFLLTKQIFRRDNLLDRAYEDISEALGQEMSRRSEDDENIFLEAVVQKICSYVEKRRDMLQLYQQVHGEVITEAFVDQTVSTLERVHVDLEEAQLSPGMVGLFKLMHEEVSILLSCFVTHTAISSCQIFPSLVELKTLQSHLTNWTSRVDALVATLEKHRPSFFRRLVSPSPVASLPKLGVIQWFVFFFHALVAKFSVYFHDALLPHSVRSNIRLNFTPPHASLNLYSLFQSFFRRHSPIALGIFLGYEGHTFPFGDTRYHAGGMRNCKSCCHLLGPAGSKYSPLLRLGVGDHKLFFSKWFPLIEAVIKQIGDEEADKAVNSKRLRHRFDSDTATMTYAAPIERRVFFALIFKSKTPEPDARAQVLGEFTVSVMNFLNGSKMDDFVEIREHLTPEEWEALLQGQTPEDWEAHLQQYGLAENPLENARRCVPGVFESLWRQIAVLLLCSLLQGVVTPLRRSRPTTHNALLCLLGILCLVYILPSPTTVSIVVAYVFAFAAVKSIFGGRNHFGVLSAVFSILFLLGCQNLLDDAVFVAFRGALMIQIMKSVSISFYAPSKVAEVPLSSLFAYLLNPGTLIFGPFVTFDEFSTSEGLWTRGFQKVAKALGAFALSLVFLFSATCLVEELLQTLTAAHWILDAYKTAMSFRFGHYYICQLSFALCRLAGVETGPVTDWMAIEIPRSMVDVVVGWNVPMNHFLHKCECLSPSPHVVPFQACSPTCGFNFQLTAVLLSLGLYSFAEHQFRQALSRRLDACVKARRCAEECPHAHKSLALQTAPTNFAFSALAVFHLVYLGMVFDNSDGEAAGYSMTHTLSKWAEWRFSSHLVAVAMLLLRYTVL
ncbi:hypothetical protein QR680_017389 [Steinernema hermaphroditum]|uniref:Uncharacterized protein n=1 Tax=Steinernema hermaphroditum TaxID=289476 RepID=A0AA39HGE2_9BILA|nr:hypothetical protein QR680_017389 [Steinernema hermaphroditum]